MPGEDTGASFSFPVKIQEILLVGGQRCVSYFLSLVDLSDPFIRPSQMEASIGLEIMNGLSLCSSVLVKGVYKLYYVSDVSKNAYTEQIKSFNIDRFDSIQLLTDPVQPGLFYNHLCH